MPWRYFSDRKGLKQKVEELEEDVEELKDERESYRKRFEAEKDRRAKISTEKQEAEKELKKLRQKLENRPETSKKKEKTEKVFEINITRFKIIRRGLDKISKIESSDKDLLTVYRRKDSDIDDLKAFKNSASQEVFGELTEKQDFIAFTDEDFFRFRISCRPFFESSWSLGENFETEKLIQFIEKEKYWVMASKGNTGIYREASGKFDEVERVKSRVDSQQKKGGFSQGRFERKRDEQTDQHVKNVNSKIKDLEGEIYVIGDKRLCEDINAEYLGGFDSSRPVSADVFYNFKFTRF